MNSNLAVSQDSSGVVTTTLYLDAAFFAQIPTSSNLISLQTSQATGNPLCSTTATVSTPSVACPAGMSGNLCMAVSCQAPASAVARVSAATQFVMTSGVAKTDDQRLASTSALAAPMTSPPSTGVTSEPPKDSSTGGFPLTIGLAIGAGVVLLALITFGCVFVRRKSAKNNRDMQLKEFTNAPSSSTHSYYSRDSQVARSEFSYTKSDHFSAQGVVTTPAPSADIKPAPKTNGTAHLEMTTTLPQHPNLQQQQMSAFEAQQRVELIQKEQDMYQQHLEAMQALQAQIDKIQQTQQVRLPQAANKQLSQQQKQTGQEYSGYYDNAGVYHYYLPSDE
ncbi:hypothetical protein HDU98_004283 [Podochytrium sp. JEL0797]|nr:hypothetical protein HDU98_004283 [Podochytrium sp. JEL0797]